MICIFMEITTYTPIHTCGSVFVSMFLFSYSLISLEKKKEAQRWIYLFHWRAHKKTHSRGLSQDTHWPISCNTSMFLTHNFLFIIYITENEIISK